jgi:ATP/ADP translocase
MSEWKGKETTFTGMLTFACMLFVGSNMLNTFGWLFTALFTPIVSTIFCLIFYITGINSSIAKLGLLFVDGELKSTFAGTGNDSSWAVLYIGIIMVVFIKSFKYATLDPTKEMAYLPLTSHEKSQAKAVVDIVGARAGKSVGSLFNIFFVSQFGGNAVAEKGMLWCSFIFSLLLLVIWISSAKQLDFYIKEREKLNKINQAKNKIIKSTQNIEELQDKC